jgi:hypothetical protein
VLVQEKTLFVSICDPTMFNLFGGPKKQRWETWILVFLMAEKDICHSVKGYASYKIKHEVLGFITNVA